MTMLALFFVSYCARLWQMNGRVAGKTIALQGQSAA
jgi:hypothetical protein